jgi:hypothetical protein
MLDDSDQSDHRSPRGSGAGGAPGALLETAARCAAAAARSDNADTAAAVAPRRSHRCAPAVADARAGHTPIPPCDLAAEGGPRACLARTGRRPAARPHGAPLELLFQFVVFPAQPLALRLRPSQILALPLILTAQLVDDLLSSAIGRSRSGTRWLCQNRDQSTSTENWIRDSHPLNNYTMPSRSRRQATRNRSLPRPAIALTNSSPNKGGDA